MFTNFQNFDKVLSGEYKAKLFSADGENYATFTVQSGSWKILFDFSSTCKFISRCPRVLRETEDCSTRRRKRDLH